jgi:hypothetical protein
LLKCNEKRFMFIYLCFVAHSGMKAFNTVG